MTNYKADYVPYLDGMRGLAIIFVILAHIGLGRYVPGGFGVSLFFFISGFLITKLLISEYEDTQTISLKKFYLRRAARLYPALLAMTVLAVIIILIHRDLIHFTAILSSLFYFANYYYIYLKPPAVDCFDEIFNIAWSLSVEEHFYLVFPILFYWLYYKKQMLLNVLLAVCILSLAYRFFLLHQSTNAAATIKTIYVVTETRVDSIIWGCIAALLIYKNNSKYYVRLLQSKWATVLGLAILLHSFLFKHTLFVEAIRFTKQALAFFLLVPSVNYLGASSLVKKMFENAMLVFIGKLSYSLYLFHWISVTLANYYFKEATVLWLVFALCLTTVLALASYYFIERPFVGLRKKLGSHVK